MQQSPIFNTAGSAEASALSTNKVLRNTYMLLSMTLLFSAITATAAIFTNAQPIGFIGLIIGFYGLLFATHKLANSSWGILAVFALTGFMGYTIGPIINVFLQTSAGSQIVVQALAGTGLIFFSLSGYALVSRKDFSFLNSFVFAGIAIILISIVANIFLKIPAISLAISAAFMLISSAIILQQTSSIIHGGERNYILATVTLFVSLYNIFLSLLNILGFLSGDD